MGNTVILEQVQDTARSSRAWTMALTSVAFFMVALDLLVVITALPAMQRDLGASLSTLEWTINAYTLPYAAGIITAAALGDRLGRRRVFVAGLLLFTAASAGCALAPRRDPHRRARDSGHRRGARHAPQPDHPERCLSAGATRRDHRHLGRHRRPGRGQRSSRRRRRNRGARLALDLLAERADFRRGRVLRAHAARRELRPADAARSARRGPRVGRRYRRCVGARAGNRRRPGHRRGDWRLGSWSLAPHRVPDLGGPRLRADAAAQALREPGLLGCECDSVPDDRGPFCRCLPRHSVLPVWSGPFAI